MMTWFNGREPRERVLLMILAGMLVLFLGWFVLTRDSGPDPDDVLAEAQTDRELWLRAAPRLSASDGGTSVRADFTRGALIDLARRRNVALTRVQPQNDGSLTVWIDDVGTVPLYDLMDALVTGYAVDVQTVLIGRTAGGSLDAQFTLAPT